MLGTVQRAGEVLDLFSAQQPEWGATSVARELQIAKSQAYELLVSLCAIGLLRRTQSARYLLGWRTVTLGAAVIGSGDFTREASRAMRELVLGLPEATAHLTVWDQGRVVCIGRRQGANAVGGHDAVFPLTGSWVPPHCTSVGKVLLAAQPPSELDRFLGEARLERFTANTIVRPDRLRAEIEAVERQGFAIDLGELDVDTRCTAAPIYQRSGEVSAAMGLSVSSDHWSRRSHEYTRAVVTATENITQLIRRRPRKSEAVIGGVAAGVV